MKLFLAILALVLLVATLYADWKWRQWMAARRRDREQDRNFPPYPPLQ